MFVTVNDVFVDQSMEVKEVTRVVDLVERGPSHLRPVDDVAESAPYSLPSSAPSG